MNEAPLVSVVIPAKNSADTIGECLESIRRSTYTNYEVIVVDGHSRDGTVQIARDLGARVLEGGGKGWGADCNIGFREARGEIIATTDADCVVDSHWLERIVMAFQVPGIGATGGPDLTYTKGATPVERAAGHIHCFIRLLATRSGADAVIPCNTAYRREAVLKAGGFDENFRGGNDTPLNADILRLGYSIASDPQCIVYHKRRVTFRALLKQFWKFGWEMGHIHRKNPRDYAARKRHIYPLLAGVLALVLLAALSIPFPTLAWAFPTLALGYLLFQFGLHCYLIRKTGFSSPFWVFLVASTLAMLLFTASFAREQVIPRKARG